MKTTIAIAAVGLVTVVQGAYTIKLRGEIAALSSRAGLGPSNAEEAVEKTLRMAHRASVPKLAPPPVDPGTLPLPAAIASDSSREMVRTFVAAEVTRLKHEKDEAKRVKKEGKTVEKAARQEKEQAAYRARLTQTMGLSDSDARRVIQVLVSADNARRQLREAERNGLAQPADTERSLAALRAGTQNDMRSALGENWAMKLEEAHRKLEDVKNKETQAARAAANKSKGPFWWFAS